MTPPAPGAELSADELRAVQAGALAKVDRWCREHGVPYYLAYGTLLGAVRHGGPIPWDDDVDVMLPRAAYDRLVRELAADGPPWLSVSTSPQRPEWPLPYAKVCDDRTTLVEALADPVAMGVNVDVFPLDAVPAGRARRRTQAAALRFLRWAVELHYVDGVRARGWHGPVALRVARPLLRLLPVRVLVGATTWVAAHPGRPSGRLGVRVGSFDWSVPAAALGEPVEVDFAGLRCLAPADADAVLTTLYGDYRTPPPAHQQVSHHAFTARWR
ncbi:LicD family protein [Nocardioides perillae]|uniref:Lipopolysaccharide cholinephosphotransferase n=1 Tax=Nocardioides perillae TaxID=1119534 RepID=A0A7Y9UR87_9ACTN|nr:lipopolysaccharide cholinephosphotransferase [Nocardioides perillae]